MEELSENLNREIASIRKDTEKPQKRIIQK